MSKLTIQLTKRSVNSKLLAAAVEEFLNEAIHDILREGSGNWSGRDWFVELMDAWMYGVATEGKIVQWDVICDARNNKISELDAGRLHIDVHYKQYDCVNTTHFSYILSNNSKDDTNEEDDGDMFN